MSSRFKKDFKACIKRGLSLKDFQTVIEYLKYGSVLPLKYRDHPLRDSKDYKNCRELHINPDWLLIYKYNNDDLILYLIRTGSHSDLLKN